MRTTFFSQLALITIVFVFTILFTGCDKHPIEEKQINVVFRFDDYSAHSATELELRIINVFRKHEASITFGVVPFVVTHSYHDPSPQDIAPLTPKKGDILKKGYGDGVLDIVLHGYSHQTNNAVKMTEFSGLDYYSQLERLAKGKKLLENIIDAPVTTFVPPWDSFDINTLRALEELEFATLSAAENGPSTKSTKLSFLPAIYDIPLPRIRDAVEAARTSSDNQPLIVVVFHEYDFKEVDEKQGTITFQDFEDQLSWLKTQNNVRLLSIGQATKVINDLSAKRFLLAQRYLSLSRYLPSLLSEEFIYQESPDMLKTRLKISGFYFAIFSLGAGLSFMVGVQVFPRSAFIMNIGTFGSIVLSLIIFIYAFHDLKVHLKGMTVSTGVIGTSAGLCSCFLYVKKKKIWDRSSTGERVQA